MGEGSKHVYVGTTACGCRVAVVADLPESRKFTAESIAEYVRDGLTVTRERLDDFRMKSLHRCTHGERPVPHE